MYEIHHTILQTRDCLISSKNVIIGLDPIIYIVALQNFIDYQI